MPEEQNETVEYSCRFCRDRREWCSRCGQATSCDCGAERVTCQACAPKVHG